jgi:hypothetical protein
MTWRTRSIRPSAIVLLLGIPVGVLSLSSTAHRWTLLGDDLSLWTRMEFERVRLRPNRSRLLRKSQATACARGLRPGASAETPAWTTPGARLG